MIFSILMFSSVYSDVLVSVVFFFFFHHWFLPLFLGCFHCWFDCLFSCHQLCCFFVIYSFFVSLYCECYRCERAFFNIRCFLPYTLPHIWCNLFLIRLPWDPVVLPWWLQASHGGSKHRPSPSVYLNHAVFGK